MGALLSRKQSAEAIQPETVQAPRFSRGHWVTPRVYGEAYSISVNVLANWRHLDIVAGRTEAGPGFPRYTRFGRAIRYWLPDDLEATR